MRTFSQFDPKVSVLIMFRVRHGSEKDLTEAMQKNIQGKDGIKTELVQKEDWTVIEITKDLTGETQGFVSISPDLYKVKKDEMKPVITRVKELISPHLAEGSKIFTIDLFTSGTRDSAWLRNYSDVTFLYKDGKDEQNEGRDGPGETYQTNVAYLNRVMNLQGKVLVNSINQGGVLGNLYILGYRTDSPMQRNLMIEIDMATLKTLEVYQNPSLAVKELNPYSVKGDGEAEPYLRRQNYLVTLIGIKNKLIDLFLINAQMEDLISREAIGLRARGSGLLDEIFSVQNAINEHMKSYAQEGQERKRESRKDREVYRTEKSLLTRASVHFSIVSEIENEILRTSGRLLDLEERIADRSSSLSMEYDPRSTEETHLTFGDVNLRRIDQEKRSLTNLSEQLMHSRVILTSTIEVLRTFIDTRQREISEDMNRLMNIIFLVLAVFGLADALGNFVVIIIQNGYITETSSVPEIWTVTFVAMSLTLVPLLISAVFLYLFFQKR